MAVLGRPFTIACSGYYSARTGLRVSVTATAFMRGREGVDWATSPSPPSVELEIDVDFLAAPGLQVAP